MTDDCACELWGPAGCPACSGQWQQRKEGTMTIELAEEHSTNLFGARNALAVIDAATEMALPLARIIEEQHLYTDIRGRRHVRVEGWTLLGSMLGVFPVVCWTRPLDDGWEARVEARTRDGAVVGAAEAECLRTEGTWRSRDDYALRSMAQTRATSKALRLPLGFVIQLAGFETTPAEEMPAEDAPAGPPCPHCGAPVLFNEERTRGKKPVWSCSNRGCGGGSPRDKNDPSKGNWPWGSYDADFFAGGGGTVEKPALERPGAEPPTPQAWSENPNLVALGLTDEQARAELETYRHHPGFAAGSVSDMRKRIDRACTLLVALGEEPEGLRGELFAEWQRADPARATLTVSTLRAHDVQLFADHVRGFLNVR